jgi:hypothetical protein
VSKDFGELGSLFEQSEFEQVPKVCEQNRMECPFCDRERKHGNRAAPWRTYL